MFCFAISAKAFKILEVSGAGWPGAVDPVPFDACDCCWVPVSGLKFGAGDPSGVVDATSSKTSEPV